MRKACVKNAIVSVAEKQEPPSVSTLIEWAMRGVSATNATAIGTTKSLETRANRSSRIMTKNQKMFQMVINISFNRQMNIQVTEVKLNVNRIKDKI